jgi:tetratricopeptide (TPR) repeat protein
MEHRVKRDHTLINLVTDYENRTANGNVTYLDDKSFVQLIEYYDREGMIERAMQVVDNALEQYAYHFEFHLARAKLFFKDGNPYLALKILDKADLISPNEFESRILRASVYCDLRRYSEALSLLEQLKETIHRDDVLEILLCEAHIYEHMRDFERMFTTLQRVLLKNPTQQEALEKMWVCVELAKKYDSSIEFHQYLIDMEPYSYLAWYNLGHAYASKGEYEKAIYSLEYSFLINDRFELAYRDCAELCLQIQQYQKALQVYSEELEVLGPESELLVSIGECYIYLKDHSLARKFLRRSIRYDPYNDEAYYFLSLCLIESGEWSNAVMTLNKAIELDDRREEYYFELAKVYTHLNKLKSAGECYKNATQTGSEQIIYWFGYVKFLLKQNLVEDAREVLDEADYYTYGPELVYCKAVVLFLFDDKKEAMNLLAEALQENFEAHTVIFELLPSLGLDEDVRSIIKYYEGETVE